MVRPADAPGPAAAPSAAGSTDVRSAAERGRADPAEPVDVERAAQRIADGEVVAFPTETVYGLGARADDDRAVARIFALKGRPTDHPLIVHVLDAAAAEAFADRLPPSARRLIAAFWPGPLTVVVPRRGGIAQAAAGGQPSIGLRCPSHPVARALLAEARRLGVPGVAAPSANRFGRVSPTRASHVTAEFGGAVPVLDGGSCEVGLESTLVDCTRAQTVLLRPGAIARERVEAVLGERLLERDAAAPRASGTLEVHYAPRARVEVLAPEELTRRLSQRQPGMAPARLGVYSPRASLPTDAAGATWQRRRPAEADATARELYAVLREFDDAGADAIWVEAVPDAPAWEAVADRLRRAAAR